MSTLHETPQKQPQTKGVIAKIEAVERLQNELDPSRNHARFRKTLDNKQLRLIAKHRNWRGRVVGWLTLGLISSHGNKFAGNCIKILSLPSCHARISWPFKSRLKGLKEKALFFRNKTEIKGPVAAKEVEAPQAPSVKVVST